MDNLALELLEHIFTLACTDGGCTGCAPSLVSTHIRAASRTARFYSIALTSGSPEQIANFIACFIPATSAFAGCLPRVRHLCLTLDTRTRGREQEGGTVLKATPIVRTLFRAVAPGLRSLALVVRGELAWIDVFAQLGVEFPALEELTYESQWVQDDESEDEDEVGEQEVLGERSDIQLFPHLARLHLVADAVMDLASWATHAPCLTHLCISKLGFQDYDTVRAVIGERCFFPSSSWSRCLPSNADPDVMLTFSLQTTPARPLCSLTWNACCFLRADSRTPADAVIPP